MEATLEKPAIDAKLVAPFITSVRSVFKTMASLDVAVDKPFLKDEQTTTFMVSGIIGFSGQVIGSVTVSFHAETAKKLVAAFAGIEMDLKSPDFADAVGELANMIAGGAKKDLGGNANITVPTVVIGADHVVARLRGVPCVVLPCKTTAGEFTIEVSIKRV